MLITIITGVVCLLLGYASRLLYAKTKISSEIKKAQDRKQRILKEAEAEKKEILIHAKDELILDRRDFEQESKARRNELNQQQNNLQEREKQTQQKKEELNRRLDALTNKEKMIEQVLEKQNQKLSELVHELEAVSGYSAKQAEEILFQRVEQKAQDRAAKLVQKIEEDAHASAEKKSQYILTSSMQRMASNITSEVTTSSVHLPSDEMKGRIIGREGRNIRTLESLTGVDVIIDDTPETVVVSCFDPVRREIAKLSLERLIQDGRIQPTRIEEIVLKVKSELDEIIMDTGEKSRIELKIPFLHQDIIKYIGRLKFRTSYGQNVLDHVKEVALLSGYIAKEMGLDIELATRAGFLHDIGKSIIVDGLGSHPDVGAEFLQKLGEHEYVVEAAKLHHDNPQNITNPITLCVMSADAISASRPGARDKAVDSYVKRLTQLENIAKTFDGVESAFAIQAGRELRVIVNNQLVDDSNAGKLAKEIVDEIEDTMVYPGQIKVAVIRESRAIQYAQ